MGIKYYSNSSGSPDLSIIENVWRVHKQYIKKNKAQSIEQLRWAIEAEWNAIPQETIDKYVLSMPQRIQEVLQRNGLATQF